MDKYCSTLNSTAVVARDTSPLQVQFRIPVVVGDREQVPGVLVFLLLRRADGVVGVDDGDDVVVVANFFCDAQDGYVIGFPRAGTWKLRFNSDWQGYNDDFHNHPSTDVVAELGNYDGFSWRGAVSIGPYSVLIFSQ